jgi:hypothetical protein
MDKSAFGYLNKVLEAIIFLFLRRKNFSLAQKAQLD